MVVIATLYQHVTALSRTSYASTYGLIGLTGFGVAMTQAYLVPLMVMITRRLSRHRPMER
jgi:hypothetical protein